MTNDITMGLGRLRAEPPKLGLVADPWEMVYTFTAPSLQFGHLVRCRVEGFHIQNTTQKTQHPVLEV